MGEQTARDALMDQLTESGLCQSAGESLLYATGIIQNLKDVGFVIERGWQPIETAPKDGRVIIVRGGTAQWAFHGWWSTVSQGYIEWPVKEWRPLPAPPEKQP